MFWNFTEKPSPKEFGELREGKGRNMEDGFGVAAVKEEDNRFSLRADRCACYSG